MDSSNLSDTRWKCQYHIVFIPKYRRKVMYGKGKADVREVLKKLCEFKLACESKLILADEPTGNLDADNSCNIINLLKEFVRDGNSCAIIVTHDNFSQNKLIFGNV